MTVKAERIKVAIIGNQAFSMKNFRGPLISELVALGHEVFALAPDYEEEDRQTIVALGATPIDFSLDRNGMNPVRDAVDVFRLARVLKMLQVDVVLSYFIKPVVYGTIAARLARVPWRVALIEGAGTTLSDGTGGLKERLIRRVVVGLCRLGLRQAHHVIFLNDDDIELFTRTNMVQSSQVRKIDGIGIDLAAFRASPVTSSPLQFLMMARLLYEKGVGEFIEAARIVKASHPNIRFTLLGGIDSNPNAVAETLVKRWVTEGVIDWPGQVDDVRPWLQQTSVFVLPSYYREGLPRSTLEAMAMARPIITTDWVGCRETVIDGVNGFLVPVRDPIILAEAMLRFVAQPELLESMGQKSRNIAEQRFDVHQINKKILNAMGLYPDHE